MFVHNLSKSLNGQGRAACPFQFDVCFAVKATRDVDERTEPADDKDNIDTGDDDDDGDDGKQEDFDIFGDVEGRLKANKLIYATKESDASKEMRMFKEAYMELKYTLKSADSLVYPSRKRFVALVDRRKISTDHDTMTMFEPPEDVRDIPSNAVPEWGFAASKACILPNDNYDAEQAAQDAAIEHANAKQRMKKAHLTALSVTPNSPRHKDDTGMSSTGVVTAHVHVPHYVMRREVQAVGPGHDVPLVPRGRTGPHQMLPVPQRANHALFAAGYRHGVWLHVRCVLSGR